MPPHSDRNEPRRAMRAVAAMEAAKGLVVFGAGFGLLALLHRDVAQLAASLVTRLHLDPDRPYAAVFMDAASQVTDARLWGLAGLALAYSALRATEAFGLWFGRRWAAWLGATSGAIYVPIELYELWEKPGPVKVATLTFNVMVVTYLSWTLWRGRAPRTR